MTNFDSRRISLVEFYSNDQTLKSISEKSRGDMKKRKAVQGGGLLDGLFRKKRIRFKNKLKIGMKLVQT